MSQYSKSNGKLRYLSTFASIDDSSRLYRSLPLTTLVVRLIPGFSGAVSNDSREVT